jgi:hypothetical protein
MSCKPVFQKDSIGSNLEVEVLQNCSTSILDVSTATLKEITIERPDKTKVTRAAIFTTDGTDGLIYILTIAGDLSLEGTYRIQAEVNMPAWQGKTEIGEFEVEDNL